MKSTNKTYNPIKLMLLVFVLLTVFFLLFKGVLQQYGFDYRVLLAGNMILSLIGFLTLNRGLKAIDNPNPHVFVRVFYSGFIIRIFVCAAAAFVYIYINNGKVDKYSLFACLVIYLLYSAIEVISFKKALGENKNA